MRTTSAVLAGAILMLSMGAASVWGQGAATPKPESGNEWLARCGKLASLDVAKAKEAELNEMFNCMGWVQGFADLNAVHRGLRVVPETHVFCAPNTSTLGQMARVVAKHLEDRPAELHLEVRGLALIALVRAFPCQKGQ